MLRRERDSVRYVGRRLARMEGERDIDHTTGIYRRVIPIVEYIGIDC